MLINEHREIDFGDFPNNVTESELHFFRNTQICLGFEFSPILIKIQQESVVITDDTGVK
jgi:hypothetical protein